MDWQVGQETKTACTGHLNQPWHLPQHTSFSLIINEQIKGLKDDKEREGWLGCLLGGGVHRSV